MSKITIGSVISASPCKIEAANETAAAQSRLAQGDKDDNRIPKGGTPGWNILNMHASIDFNKLVLRSGVANIFNQDYRMHGSGINGLGRNLYISAQFRF